MKDLITKHFENKDILIIDRDGNPWFVAKDICDQLGYTNSRKAISDHCIERGVTICYLPHPQSKDKKINLTIINESNLYRLIVRSKMEHAKKFESWVYDEVLPSIRKTGEYKTAHKAERQNSKAVRNIFTSTLRDHGFKAPIEYIKVTGSMKKKLGIKGNKKKDDFDMIELLKIEAAEKLSSINILQNEANGYEQIKPLCDMSSTMVQVATGFGGQIAPELIHGFQIAGN